MASHDALTVEIITPERTVFSGTADFTILPGAAGELGILPRHAALLSRIKPGTVKIARKDSAEFAVVSHGFLEVLANRVSVVTESAVMATDIDFKAVESEREKAVEALAKSKDEPGQTRIKQQIEQADLLLSTAEKGRAGKK
jgi:F-type H+-transporting ATPase subunit epsilon